MGDTSKHLTYFKVENFKRFESFEMKDLGQFNLIVGDNNVGKTSVLEALLADENQSVFISNLFKAISFRKLYNQYTYAEFELFINKDSGESRHDFLKRKNEFDIAFVLEEQSRQLYKIEFTISLRDRTFFSNKETFPITFNTSINIDNANDLPFVPFFMGHDSDLANFYSQRIQKNPPLKRKILDAMSLMVEDLDSLELSQPYPNQSAHLIVNRKSDKAPIPLAFYGDGTTKLFRLLYEIVVNSGKRLMIDEIDTGIHYSRFKEFWRVILKTAKDNDVQLFMTTHNEECIKYFVEALAEDDMTEYQKDARSITLQELPDKSVKAYTFVYENLEANVVNGNEVRGGF